MSVVLRVTHGWRSAILPYKPGFASDKSRAFRDRSLGRDESDVA
jgi:hypothetical protein